MRHRFVPTFFPGPAPRSPACVDPRVGTRGPRLASGISHGAFPAVAPRSGKRRGKTQTCDKWSRRRACWQQPAVRSGAAARPRCVVGPAAPVRGWPWAAGAPGLLGAPPPAPRIPGPGGERGGRPARAAGCARAARSAESWGRSLARPPPRSQSLAFCAATLPDPRGPRRPRARPAPLPRESLRRPAGPGGAHSARRRSARETQPLGAFWQSRPRRKATPRESSANAPGR